MTDISFNLSGKIDPLLSEVLSLVSREAARLNIPFFIVGAMARDIVLEHCYKLPPRRSTRDLDIGVEVAGWEEYEKLTQALISTGKFERAREPNALMHGEFKVDIVPFGGVSPDQKTISWPPEHAVVMSILGFKEAYDTSLLIRIHDAPVLEVRVPTVPGMALMKIISWSDRYPERPKDAVDLLFLMEHYASAGNEDRLYGEEARFMEKEGFDIDLAAIRLLGHDMAIMATEMTRELVKGILSRELDDEHHRHLLIRDMIGSSFWTRERVDIIREKLKRLRQGFEECLNEANE
ncbi:MAG: nucleotidyl transferase AbiEii/AbiGii toxin family protein [Desulfomonilia bacterium]